MREFLLVLLSFLPLGAVGETVLRAGLWSHETDTSIAVMDARASDSTKVREVMRSLGMRLSPDGQITRMCFPSHVLGVDDASTLASLGPSARITHLSASETAFSTRVESEGAVTITRYRWLQADCEELAVMKIEGRSGPEVPVAEVQPDKEGGRAAQVAQAPPGSTAVHSPSMPSELGLGKRQMVQVDASTPLVPSVPQRPQPRSPPVAVAAAPPAVILSPAPAPAKPPALATLRQQIEAAPTTPQGERKQHPAQSVPPGSLASAPSTLGKDAAPPAENGGELRYTHWLNFRSDKPGLRYRLALERMEGTVGYLKLQIAVNEEAHCFNPRCDGYVLVVAYRNAYSGDQDAHFRFGPHFRGPYTVPGHLHIEFKTWPDGGVRSFDPEEGIMSGTPPRPSGLSSCLDNPLRDSPQHQCWTRFKPERAVYLE